MSVHNRPYLLFPVFFFGGILLLSLVLFQNCKSNDPPRILVFSKTEGYRHASIPTGVAALRKLCRENGMLMDSTEDAAAFTEKNLRRYDAVVFLSTTGDVLNPTQEAEFERYIQAGGGFVGIHAASDTEYGWTWFGGLVGGYFDSHPEIQNARLTVERHDHPATKHLGKEWNRRDEWYNFKDMNPKVEVLLKIDESSYKNGKMGADHPMSWFHEYDGGRAFYTALGHTEESFSEPDFLKHILGGLKYAIGSRKHLKYAQCRTPALPDPTRFIKTVLASDLTEPMEFEMFPDGKIILIERRGAIKLFNPNTGLITVAYKLPVHSEEEDGLMGLALDPNWEKNHWIYLYYSPVGNKSVNYLSRFKFAGDTLDRASEIVMLEVAVQREECCHAAGCIEFDEEGLLYLSTGDNTNPFASEGYNPIDERPGRSAWDAQKSSANTMDLRGKILRIQPLPDGSYICPAGNLFTDKDVHVANPTPFNPTPGPSPEGEGGRSVHSEPLASPLPFRGGAGGGVEGVGVGRPEIYVMGCRNPFRLSIDSRRRLLFWGEVGPDAGEPDSTRGPAGHDEVNRAGKAGFFGWPYFVGNNKPYRDYDFRTKTPGPYFRSRTPRE
jgi:cytochrome c